jgi:hypothetical protein
MKFTTLFTALFTMGVATAIAVPGELREDGTMCWKEGRE